MGERKIRQSLQIILAALVTSFWFYFPGEGWPLEELLKPEPQIITVLKGSRFSFSPDGSKIAILSPRTPGKAIEVKLLKVSDGGLIKLVILDEKILGPPVYIDTESLSFTSKGLRIAAAFIRPSRTVKIWDEDGRMLCSFVAKTEHRTALGYIDDIIITPTADKALVVPHSSSSKAELWDITSRNGVFIRFLDIPGTLSRYQTASFNSDGTKVLNLPYRTDFPRLPANILDVRTGEIITSITSLDKLLRAIKEYKFSTGGWVAWSPEGVIAVFKPDMGAIGLLEANTTEVLATLKEPEEQQPWHFNQVSFNADGGKLAVAYTYGKIYLWNLPPLVAKPATPVLVYPALGSVLDTAEASSLILKWEENPRPVLYHVQLSKGENFTEAEIIAQDITGRNVFPVPIGKLSNKHVYYWKVGAIGLKHITWSPINYFSVNAQRNIVRLRPKSIDSERVIIEIYAEKVRSLFGYEIDLQFDPSVLEVENVEEGDLLGKGGETFWISPIVDDKSGVISLLSTRIAPGEVSGEGVLAYIHFKVKRPEALVRSIVSFKQIKFSDGSGNSIPVLPIETPKLGLHATFIAIPKVENNHIIVDIFCEDPVGVKSYALDVEFPEALELVEGNVHIEGGEILEPGIVSTCKFKIWEGGEMLFHLKNGIIRDEQGNVEVPVLVDGSIKVVSSPAWDLNKDYVVDILDLVILAKNFKAKITGNPRPNPDINGDGLVDIFDFVKVGEHFHESYSAIPGAPVLITKKQDDEKIAAAYLPILKEICAEFEKQIPGEEYAKIRELLLELIKSCDYEPLPQETRLLANYPNPFNSETWIPYQLSEDADVMIQIYDLNGKIVRTLYLGHKRAGYYTSKQKAAYWDGRNDLGEKVTSGIYFYTIQAGRFLATRKMVITR
jgi:WD40 repeat protein